MISEILHKIVAHPRIYDWVQKAAGAGIVGPFLTPHLAVSAGHLLLEVGAGTGNCRILMPASTRYIWMDNDAQKLAGYRRKRQSGLSVMGDATQLCFRDKSVDYALCSAVLHHLDDDGLTRLIDELARVVRRQVIVIDPVECTDRMVSNLLWKWDRGSFPRTGERIRAAFGHRFELEHVDELTVYHRYILCVANPKN